MKCHRRARLFTDETIALPCRFGYVNDLLWRVNVILSIFQFGLETISDIIDNI